MMKLRYGLLLVVLCGIVRATPEFIGFMRTAESGYLFIVVPASGSPALWVKIGDEVLGYVVSEIRDDNEVLVLKKDNQELPLRLRPSKVKNGESHAAAAPDAKKVFKFAPGDQLSVQVFEQPGLGIKECTVDAKGQLIVRGVSDPITVSGLSLSEVQAVIQRLYESMGVPSPRVKVLILHFAAR